jgi:hypothetical protein
VTSQLSECQVFDVGNGLQRTNMMNERSQSVPVICLVSLSLSLSLYVTFHGTLRK